MPDAFPVSRLENAWHWGSIRLSSTCFPSPQIPLFSYFCLFPFAFCLGRGNRAADPPQLHLFSPYSG